MAIGFDHALGLHESALLLRERRAGVLAANLANADTPQFKARDLDFRAALNAAGYADAGGGLPLSTTQGTHLSGPGGSAGPQGALRYRNPLAPALDGNTVDVQVEQAAFAENAVRYQATLTFINSRLRGLMTAITGQ